MNYGFGGPYGGAAGGWGAFSSFGAGGYGMAAPPQQMPSRGANFREGVYNESLATFYQLSRI